ncbi:MAG TPA: arginine deiminase-related protein [Candidatus Binatia bacterium]|nr:arginine deiminase-related protein [Candidatus Binatia bacterium]
MTQSSAVTQSTNSVLMIRPCRFYPNPETAADNAFQARLDRAADALSPIARKEFDAAVQTLRAAGVNVHVFDDTTEPEKPDAVFPNNWISTHHDGRIALFPMYSALRRRERRHDIVEELRKRYRVTEVIDYSAFEEEGCCLEGTGSLVLDHLNKIAYVSLSNRSNLKVIRRFASDFSYEPVTFTSIGSDGQPIYHTNVMMCIGTAFALVGLQIIRNKGEQQQVRERLERSAKDIVELSPDQIANFAGNAIELHDMHGEKLLVLSERAIRALTEEQRARLAHYVRLVPLELPTIELGGGSARCMIATIHLSPGAHD